MEESGAHAQHAAAVQPLTAAANGGDEQAHLQQQQEEQQQQQHQEAETDPSSPAETAPSMPALHTLRPADPDSDPHSHPDAPDQLAPAPEQQELQQEPEQKQEPEESEQEPEQADEPAQATREEQAHDTAHDADADAPQAPVPITPDADANANANADADVDSDPNAGAAADAAAVAAASSSSSADALLSELSSLDHEASGAAAAAGDAGGEGPGGLLILGGSNGGSSGSSGGTGLGSACGSGSATPVPRFVKSLSSDVDAAEALALFLALRSGHNSGGGGGGSGGGGGGSGGGNKESLGDATDGDNDSQTADHESESYFSEYSDAELGELSEVFSVLRVSEGETIMSRGEQASFVAIVLGGRCAAVLSPSQRVPLGPGQLLGEMSLFVGGVRTADMVTTEESTLAVLSFAELDALPHAGERWRALQTKLLKTLAVASISKLRATIAKTEASAHSAVPAATEAPAPPTAEAIAAGSTDATATPATATADAADTVSSSSSVTAGAAAAADASPSTSLVPSPSSDARSLRPSVAPQPGPGYTRESLYRVRLALEKDKNAARLVASTERALRIAVEQKNHTAHATVERYRVLSERLKLEIQSLQTRLQQSESRFEPAQAEVARLESALARSHAETDSLHTKLSAATSALESATRAAEVARNAGLAEGAAQIEALRSQLEESRLREADALSRANHAAQGFDSRLASEQVRTRAVEQSLSDSVAREALLRDEVAQMRTALQRAREEVRVAEASLQSCTLSLTLARAEALEESRRARESLVLQGRVEELESAALADRKANTATQSHLLSRVSTLSHDLARYRLLLLHVATSAFVKLHRLKRAVRSAHMQVSEMLVDILEGHLVATGGAGAGAGAGTGAGTAEGASESSGPSLVDAIGSAGASGLSAADGTAGGNGNSGTAPSEASLTLLRKRLVHKKRAYLESVEKKLRGPTHASERERAAHKRAHGQGQGQAQGQGHSGMGMGMGVGGALAAAAASAFKTATVPPVLSLHELILSLEEELFKLRRPFTEVTQRIHHWKRTSECFFARSIELTSEVVACKEREGAAARAERRAGEVVRVQRGELQAAQGVVASLRAEIAHLHSSNQSLRSQARQLAGAAADQVEARKGEVESLESKIVMRKAQLQYMQQRYVETADALKTMCDSAAAAAAAAAGSSPATAAPAPLAVPSVQLSPPRPPPHYPPPPPSAARVWGHSPSMTELFASTLGITVPPGVGGADGKSATAAGDESATGGASVSPAEDPSRPALYPASYASSVPPSHLDPEAFHTKSLRLFAQTTQQRFALEELDKWKAVQFVLENAPEPLPAAGTAPTAATAAAGGGRDKLSPRSKTKNRKPAGGGNGDDAASAAPASDPLVSALSSRLEVSALGIADNYASVFSDRHYTSLDPLHDVYESGGGRNNAADEAFGTAAPRSRAEEEEAKQAWMVGSATHRIRDIKTRMGRAHAGETAVGGGGVAGSSGHSSSLRAANQFHSNVASRNSTDILQNGSLRSVGSSPAHAVAGGAAAPSLHAQGMSTYSSVIPAPTTSERLAPDYSRTLMLLKPGLPGGPGASSGGSVSGGGGGGGGGASSLVRQFAGSEGGGTRNFAEVYAAAAAAPTSSYARATPPPVPSAAAAAAMRASAADLRMAPASAYVHSAAAAAAGLPSSTQPLRSARNPGQFSSATSLGPGPGSAPAPASTSGSSSARGSRPAASPKSKRLQQGAPAMGPGHGFAPPPPGPPLQSQSSQPSLFPMLSPRTPARDRAAPDFPAAGQQ